MTPRGSPAFQFYPDNFLGSAKVGLMSAEEVGIYWLILCLDWMEGGFELDPAALSRWCRVSPETFTAAWDHVLSRCFQKPTGRGKKYSNGRLGKEKRKQVEWALKSRAGGISSGRARTLAANQRPTKGATKGQPLPQPKGNTPSPSPSPSPTPVKAAAASPRIVLTVAANEGITARYGEQTRPIDANAGHTLVAVEAIAAAGVPLDFAAQAIRDAAGSLNGAKAPGTLKYFVGAVLDRWREHNQPSELEQQIASLHEWAKTQPDYQPPDHA